jgi:hypothetical protein
MAAEPFPILLTKEQRECLRSHALKGSLALMALESASEIDPKFLAAVANGGAEVDISYEAASAAELKALARVHCPSAVKAIEKAIKYNLDVYRAAQQA